MMSAIVFWAYTAVAFLFGVAAGIAWRPAVEAIIRSRQIREAKVVDLSRYRVRRRPKTIDGKIVGRWRWRGLR